MAASSWTVDDIPEDLSGKTIFITGCTSGIGLEAARVFASRKCRLILACRNRDSMAALAPQLEQLGSSRVDQLVCDLGNFESVRNCAEEALLLTADPSATIDVLLLNAGMITLTNSTCSAGVELIMAVNHLGHFLLTGLLFPQLSTNARIICVSSIANKLVTDDIPWEKISTGDVANYAGQMYSYSKLANMLFVEELNRRLPSTSQIIAVGAHPGVTRSQIWAKADGNWRKPLYEWAISSVGQPTAHGAWPLLMAAVDPEISRDCYYAPSKSFGYAEFYGPPTRNGLKIDAIRDEKQAKICWEESEKLTNFKFVL